MKTESAFTSPSYKTKYNQNTISLGAENKKLYIGTGNEIATSFGTIYKGKVLDQDANKESIYAAPIDQYKFNLTEEGVATKVNIGPLALLTEPGTYTTKIKADGNDTLSFSKIPNVETVISNVKALKDDQVGITFKITRKNQPDSVNVVKVVAHKNDMDKLLSTAEGLTPEVLAAAKDQLKAAGLNTEAPVKKSGEARGKVSPEVAESALNSRAIMYGEAHKGNPNFLKYKAELEEFYTVTECDGKYTVKRKEETTTTAPAVAEKPKIVLDPETGIGVTPAVEGDLTAQPVAEPSPSVSNRETSLSNDDVPIEPLPFYHRPIAGRQAGENYLNEMASDERKNSSKFKEHLKGLKMFYTVTELPNGKYKVEEKTSTTEPPKTSANTTNNSEDDQGIYLEDGSVAYPVPEWMRS